MNSIAVSRLVLRRGLHHKVPSQAQTEEASGYWVQFTRVKLGKLFFNNGEWYCREGYTFGVGKHGPKAFLDTTNVFVGSQEDLK